MAYENFSERGRGIIDELTGSGFKAEYKPAAEYLPAAEFRGQLDVEDQDVPLAVYMDENVNEGSSHYREISLRSVLFLCMNPIDGDKAFDAIRARYQNFEKLDRTALASEEEIREVNARWVEHCQRTRSEWCGSFDEKTTSSDVEYNHVSLDFKNWFDKKAMHLAEEIGRNAGVPVTPLRIYPGDMTSLCDALIGDMPFRTGLPGKFYKDFPGVSIESAENAHDLLRKSKIMAQHLTKGGYKFSSTSERAKREDWIEPDILMDLC
jgi:hypothetical protein